MMNPFRTPAIFHIARSTNEDRIPGEFVTRRASSMDSHFVHPRKSLHTLSVGFLRTVLYKRIPKRMTATTNAATPPTATTTR
jgi:hypothetical protein